MIIKVLHLIPKGRIEKDILVLAKRYDQNSIGVIFPNVLLAGWSKHMGDRQMGFTF